MSVLPSLEWNTSRLQLLARQFELTRLRLGAEATGYRCSHTAFFPDPRTNNRLMDDSQHPHDPSSIEDHDSGENPAGEDAAQNAAAGLPPVDQQNTVISSRPPLAAPPLGESIGTREVGRQLAGRRLDHFQLEEFIGGGGMGAVFRATDQQLGRTVAVKVLSRRTDEEMLWRFKNEAQSAARLDHENIARVYYVGEDDGWHFIVFEFIDGVNIRDLVHHKGALGLDEALSYVLQIADALEHAHEREVVHRDIKPSNILVTSEGHAKLVDMGLARLHQVDSDSADVTASGVTLGTFDYISPEQARDPRNTDVRSDLYSLGCTLYFMLTGSPPFPDGTVLQKLLSHSSEPPPDARLYRADLDDSIAQILQRMLAKRPEDRYQAPSELIGDLIAAAERLGLPTANRGTVWLAPGRGQAGLMAHLPWIVPAALLLVGALALERWSRTQPALPLPEPSFTKAPLAQTDSVDPPRAPTDRAGPVDPVGDDTPETASDGNNLSAEDNDPPDPLPMDPAGTDEIPDDTTAVAPERTVVVGTVTGPVAENTVTVANLTAAIMELDKDLSISTIEIRQDGPLVVRPFDLRLANRSVPQLTIRGGNGYSPWLVFQPSAEDASSQSPPMIGVHGGELLLQNLHLLLRLPDFHRQSWAVMQLDDVQGVTLRGVTATVLPPAESMADAVSDDVSLFAWSLPDPAGMMPTTGNEPDGTSSLATVSLEGCIVRGPLSVSRSSEGLPYRLTWTEGWFASSRALLELGAATTRPRWKDGGVELVLDHVTALAAGGICRLIGNERIPHPVEMTARLHSCIVMTEPNRPLFLLQGVSVFDEPPPPPKIHGAFNYYQNTDLVLAIVHRDEPDNPENYTFDFLTQHRAEQYIRQWYNELYFRPGSTLDWQSQDPPTLELPHEVTTFDLLLEEYQSDSVDVIPGFHPARVPSVPSMPALAEPGEDTSESP